MDKLDTLFCLSSPDTPPAGLDATADSIGLPKRKDGFPVYYFYRELLRPGKYIDRAAQKFEVTPDEISDLSANETGILEAGVNIPLVLDHKQDTTNTKGWLAKVKKIGKSIYGLIAAVGKAAHEMAAANEISCSLDWDYKDPTGKIWGFAIRHVSLTPQGAMTGQSKELSADSATPTVAYLSVAELGANMDSLNPPSAGAGGGMPTNPPANMASDCMNMSGSKAAHGYLMSAVPGLAQAQPHQQLDSIANHHKQLAGGAMHDSGKPPEQLKEMSASAIYEAADARRKRGIALLSAPDATTHKWAKANIETRMKALNYAPAAIDAFVKAFTQPVMLSAEALDGQTIPVEAFMDFLEKNQPTKRPEPGEQTTAQTAELSAVERKEPITGAAKTANGIADMNPKYNGKELWQIVKEAAAGAPPEMSMR